MKIDVLTNIKIKNIPHVNLIHAYKTEADDDYQVNLSNEKEQMHCMLITTEGSGYVRLKNKQKIDLHKKSIFWGNILSISYIKSTGNIWKFHCYWFQSYGIDIPNNLLMTNPHLDLQKEIDTIDKIITFGNSDITENIYISNTLFQYRLLRYLQTYKKKTLSKNSLFNEIIYYINTHITEKLQISSISNHFHFSEKHIRFLFRREANCTPKEYIVSRKLEQIHLLLRSSPLTVEELSEKYSFPSSSLLIKYFKQKYGISPHKIRTTLR